MHAAERQGPTHRDWPYTVSSQPCSSDCANKVCLHAVAELIVAWSGYANQTALPARKQMISWMVCAISAMAERAVGVG